MKMKNIQTMVEVALLTDPATRDDDCVLYASICSRISPLTNSMDMGTMLRNHVKFGLPTFESVTRARRKVQNANPELRPSPKTTDARYKKWKEVRKWAIE